MTFRELEKIVKADGWFLDSINGSHYHYEHASKTGKVTIPCHPGDLPQRVITSVFKQAGLK
jgi:predicted RNA binding protein YcfA (HicA-like mRNA interferase family)